MAQLENFRLKVFRIVAEQLSFCKAAELLLLTQPTVTLQIKALEEELGVRLFDRIAGRVALTRHGAPGDKFAHHPQNSGKNGGHNLNLHQFARDGVTLLGHVRDGKLISAPDLHETLANVDQFETNALQKVDDYIARTGLQAPQETVPQLRDGFAQEQITHLDLRAAGISTVIWATGYSFDFSLVKLPVVDDTVIPFKTAVSQITRVCTSSACPGCTVASRASCSA